MARRYGSPQAARECVPYSSTRRNLQALVTHEQFDKAHRAADALGVSVSAFMAELVERLEVDENGRPSWSSLYAPAADEPDESMGLSA